MKYSLRPREIPQAPPSGFPLCSCSVSPYIPPLVIIQIQYRPSSTDGPVRVRVRSIEVDQGTVLLFNKLFQSILSDLYACLILTLQIDKLKSIYLKDIFFKLFYQCIYLNTVFIYGV